MTRAPGPDGTAGRRDGAENDPGNGSGGAGRTGAAPAPDALGAYASTRQVATDRQFTQRAMLYAELEVARWLLHGRELRDQSIVDDAVQMLDGLVDRVHGNTVNPLSTATGPIMALDDVEALLDRTPGDVAQGYARSGGMKPVVEDQSDRSSSAV